ncbi:putative transmembrane 9 superfamily member 1 [Penaeus vannamei]|uniref:Transmembrane 9 superfamily member n=1 Tax=Penaeus vannamei TaxID=6689 RepID=A0A3R7LXS3_PENVA|nr:putative transmembrane 9 superfamily member 1 [Penaeus vannamei]
MALSKADTSGKEPELPALRERRLILLFLLYFTAIEATSFQDGDEVILYVNKVGPYFNPHETYHYYQLPVCRPKIIEHKSLTLGEVLDGDRMAKSDIRIKFKENMQNRKLCDLVLSEEEVQYLREAIEEHYYYEFVVDDIPVRDFIGHLEESGFVPHTHKVYLWTHQHFNIYYNDNKIIYVNATKEHAPISLDDVEPPLNIQPTYSVTWIPTKIAHADRGRLIQDNSFFPRSLEIHWLSIINSMVLVFLLIGFVVIILTRVLRNDFARYNIDEEGRDDIEMSMVGKSSTPMYSGSHSTRACFHPFWVLDVSSWQWQWGSSAWLCWACSMSTVTAL